MRYRLVWPVLTSEFIKKKRLLEFAAKVNASVLERKLGWWRVVEVRLPEGIISDSPEAARIMKLAKDYQIALEPQAGRQEVSIDELVGAGLVRLKPEFDCGFGYAVPQANLERTCAKCHHAEYLPGKIRIDKRHMGYKDIATTWGHHLIVSERLRQLLGKHVEGLEFIEAKDRRNNALFPRAYRLMISRTIRTRSEFAVETCEGCGRSFAKDGPDIVPSESTGGVKGPALFRSLEVVGAAPAPEGLDGQVSVHDFLATPELMFLLKEYGIQGVDWRPLKEVM